MIEFDNGTPFSQLSAERQAAYLTTVARRGAEDALRALGLDDDTAAADIKDIRDLLRALRLMRKTAWTTAVNALGRILGWALLLAMAALFLNGRYVREISSLIGG